MGGPRVICRKHKDNGDIQLERRARDTQRDFSAVGDEHLSKQHVDPSQLAGCACRKLWTRRYCVNIITYLRKRAMPLAVKTGTNTSRNLPADNSSRDHLNNKLFF